MDIAAIESRRQAIKRRMAELDRLSTSDARALDKAMTEMCALYAEYARSTVALVAFEAYRTLVERTPGRYGPGAGRHGTSARNRATPCLRRAITPSSGATCRPPWNNPSPKWGPTRNRSASQTISTICLSLRPGWSEQAPAGFIALTFREAAEQLGQMAREA